MEKKMIAIAIISNDSSLHKFKGGYSELEKLDGGMYRVWLTREQYEKFEGHEHCPLDLREKETK